MNLFRPLAVLILGAAYGCAETPTALPGVQYHPVGVAAATDPLSRIHRLPPALEQKVQRLRADLEARGYRVTRGYWTLWGTDDCKYAMHTVGMCYANNPTAPYGMAILPRWEDEFVDQPLHHAIAATQRNMTATYRLDEREALVVLGELPPPGRYFGIQTYVFTRREPINTADTIYEQAAVDPTTQGILFATSPNPSRVMMLASIGNSTNNVVMERRSGTPWGEERHFVITPDAGVADEMTAALLRAGVPTADHVFTERVSPQLVRVGLGADSDDLFTWIRYALPIDERAGEQWRERLPLTVLRVRDTSGARPKLPFPIEPLEPRAWNYDESALSSDLQALVAAVRTRWGQVTATAGSFFSAFTILDLVGPHCLGYPDPNRGPMNCIADTQDTDYQISPTLPIDDGEVIAVVGTLATRTGNATYVSLGVNRYPMLIGVANLSDTDLEGTAATFSSALQHDHRLFYVQYVARDCTGLYPCLEVSRQLLPVGERMKLLQRNYVTPGSTRGPDPTKLLDPVAIVLDGRDRP